VLSKAALDQVSPFLLLPTQLAASLVALAVLMRGTGTPLRGDDPPELGRLGLLNPGLAYAFTLVGLLTITASLSVLLGALEPFLIAALGAIVLRERVSGRLVVAFVVALIAISVVVAAPAPTPGRWIGVGLTLAGIACCALYTVLTRRLIGDAPDTTRVVFTQQAYGLAFAIGLAVAAVGLGGVPLPSPTPVVLVSAVGSGVVYYAAAYWFYLGALRRVPVAQAGAAFFLIPVFGVLASALLLGERLAPIEWIGALVVVVSVAVVLALPASGARSSAPRPIDGGSADVLLTIKWRDDPESDHA
jgi:drug/metabolite transporter (DMT)-like permease